MSKLVLLDFDWHTISAHYPAAVGRLAGLDDLHDLNGVGALISGIRCINDAYDLSFYLSASVVLSSGLDVLDHHLAMLWWRFNMDCAMRLQLAIAIIDMRELDQNLRFSNTDLDCRRCGKTGRGAEKKRQSSKADCLGQMQAP